MKNRNVVTGELYQHQQSASEAKEIAALAEKQKQAKRFYNPTKVCLKRYSAVLLIGGALVWQDMGFEYGHMGPRMRIFSNEWMESNFGEFHKMHMGRDAPTPTAGYPDTGAGWYSKRLDYKDWYEFNCA